MPKTWQINNLFYKISLNLSSENNKFNLISSYNSISYIDISDNIPYLFFETTSRKFTIKRNEKRTSTIKSLGLGRTRKKLEKTAEKRKRGVEFGCVWSQPQKNQILGNGCMFP